MTITAALPFCALAKNVTGIIFKLFIIEIKDFPFLFFPPKQNKQPK